MKEVSEHITAAMLFTLIGVGPATIIAGIVLLTSHNEAVSSITFFSIFVLDLLTATQWLRCQQTRQKNRGVPVSGQHMTVHGFIIQVKLHPELLPAGMTECDLERFRKMWSQKNHQATFDAWMKQFTYERAHGQYTE